MSELDPVDRAIADFAAGKAVIVVDNEDRENEGDLIFSAQLATPELVAFAVRYSSGYLCVGLSPERCDALHLPLMVTHNNDENFCTAFTVTVDAKLGVSTGISAKDRAHTLNVLGHPQARPQDLSRPGHIAPLRARQGGVLARPGHTEAAVDLAALAGMEPAGALVEIVSEHNPLEMARKDELIQFARRHGMTMISIEELVKYRRNCQHVVDSASLQ